ncbi:hypothetical protein [Achromobacter sp. ACM05]|uniref:hypothetical protein n=1 Tax=Achromobacter sp. ACM05 TaxID=2854776 RepID=UPI001C44BF15|nr:hypothetical protein [Achromobacter sp. ACM05]MBV7502059.1 hypothetical protein [Achromobacter sp. ACM05]
MSKRYGRNQKRRARERIAQLEAARVSDQGLLTHVRRELSNAEQVIDHARKVLGNDVALPPIERGYHPNPLGGDFRMAEQKRSFACSYENSPMFLENKVIQLRQLLARIEFRDSPRAVHFYVRLDDGNVAYAIDERAFMQMRPEELEATLLGPISRELARHLARHLSKR